MGVYIKARFNYDPDALAFIQASSIPNTSQKLAVNQLVLDLKAYGLWGKMKAIYPMVGGSAFYHKWNLKDPRDLDAAYRLSFSGGWTHSAGGAKPNGVNGYADTFLIPNSVLLQNSTHISYFSRTQSNGTEVEIGSSSGINAVDNKALIEIRTSGVTYFNVNAQSIYIQALDTDSRAFYIANRTASNVINGWRNNVKVVSGSVASTGLSTRSFYLGSFGSQAAGQYPSTKECAFASIGDGLTDTEATNLNTVVQAFQVALGRTVGAQTVSDADAQAFVNAAVIEDQIQATAINQLVTDMKGYGIWSKMKAVYPFVGGTAASHKWNLKNPLDTNAAFRLSFVGGWTHSSTGALPNGTNGYANTFLNPLTSLIINSSHVSYYSRTLSAVSTQIEMGAFTGPTDKLFHIRAAANYLAGSVSSAINFTTTTDGRGFWLGTRRADNDREAYRNGVTQTTNTSNDPNDYPNIPIYIGARNLQGTGIDFPSSKECAFATIGDGLSDTEAANFYTVVQNFNTALNRQVV